MILLFTFYESVNLNRQLFFQPGDIGREKAAVAIEKLQLNNPEIQVEGINKTIDDETVDELVKDIDLVVDALDNFTTRFFEPSRLYPTPSPETILRSRYRQ